MPVGAYGGKKEILSRVSPLGPVYQAGTSPGNPVAMASGIATLKNAARYETLRPTHRLRHETRHRAIGTGHPKPASRTSFPQIGSMWTFFFNAEPVTNLTIASKSDTAASPNSSSACSTAASIWRAASTRRTSSR